MKILQIGLGSMGKRRIRNLLALGLKDITAFDLRADRRAEAEEKYSVKTISNLDSSLVAAHDALIISTPPDKHLEYMWLAVNHGKPAFVEASVVKQGLEELAQEAERRRVFIAPSCTLKFHPAIKQVKEIVRGGEFGKVCNFIYQMGQYLPDWHPWEDIKDFYVSRKETSAGREMVPFELTWMVDIFGWPREVFAFHGQASELGVEIDDTYSINLKFDRMFGNVLVDVVARYANRNLVVNLEQASLLWNWNDKIVKLYDARGGRWIYYYEPEGKASAGYHPSIVEEMYIDELRAFFAALEGKGEFPNSLPDDIKVLEILETLESTNTGAKIGV